MRMVVTLVLGILSLTGEALDGLQSTAVCVAAQPVVNWRTADVFVSPQGRDNWSGRLADPAQRRALCHRGAGSPGRSGAACDWKEPQPVRVVLRGGTYYLDQTLEFGPDDSGTEKAPVVYAAARARKWS